MIKSNSGKVLVSIKFHFPFSSHPQMWMEEKMFSLFKIQTLLYNQVWKLWQISGLQTRFPWSKALQSSEGLHFLHADTLVDSWSHKTLRRDQARSVSCAIKIGWLWADILLKLPWLASFHFVFSSSPSQPRCSVCFGSASSNMHYGWRGTTCICE